MKNEIPVLRELTDPGRNRNANKFHMAADTVATYSEERWIMEKEIPA